MLFKGWGAFELVCNCTFDHILGVTFRSHKTLRNSDMAVLLSLYVFHTTINRCPYYDHGRLSETYYTAKIIEISTKHII